jgi:hypothetical protein
MNRREQILTVIVPEVVPSIHGSARFRSLDATWKPGDKHTTCGALPTYVARRLGIAPGYEKDGMVSFGLIAMRNAAIKAGAWCHHDMGLRAFAAGTGMTSMMRLPQPGDFYMLCSGPRHDTGCNCIGPVEDKDKHTYHGASIEHVGVIVSANRTQWRTADAGQPMGVDKDGHTIQGAAYVERTFDAATGFMTGEKSRIGKPMRRLCGWVNVDAYPFLM